MGYSAQNGLTWFCALEGRVAEAPGVDANPARQQGGRAVDLPQVACPRLLNLSRWLCPTRASALP